MFCRHERENRACFSSGSDDEDEGTFMTCCDSTLGGSTRWMLGRGCAGTCWKHLRYFRPNYAIAANPISERIIQIDSLFQT